MDRARFVYGVGILVLGVGCLLFGVAQLLGGTLSTLVSILMCIMGGTLTLVGGLVVTDSDRLGESNLSPRVSILVGILGVLFGLFLGLGSLGLLLTL